MDSVTRDAQTVRIGPVHSRRILKMEHARDTAPEPIIAAGGLVSGSGGDAGKIAIVHRRRYAGEVGLPKGKVRLAEGETVVDAAEREVREEIGKYARITEFAGLTHYLIKGRPKVVFFYYMQVVADGEGIDAGEIEFVEWLTPAEAFAKLTHAEDRQLIAKAFALGNP
jgi:8-oxo-(d)GTP phosphatase